MIPISLLLRRLSCLSALVLIVFASGVTAARAQGTTNASISVSGAPSGALLDFSYTTTRVQCGSNSGGIVNEVEYVYSSFNFVVNSTTSYSLSGTPRLVSLPYPCSSRKTGSVIFSGGLSPLPSSYDPGNSCTITLIPPTTLANPFISASLSCEPINTSIFYPAYQVVSIIYAPPGNDSSNGFTDTTSNGTTTTIANSFTDASTITFTEGFSFFGLFDMSVSESTGVSGGTSSSNAFTESFTDATGLTNETVSTSSNAINHADDLFVIWLNPEIIGVADGTTPVSYSVGVQPENGTAVAPDIVRIFANVMEAQPGSITAANPAGVSAVPEEWLIPQTDPATGLSTPGLAAICANQTYYPNNCGGDPNGQCGCSPTDFAPILALDPLLNYAGTTNPLSADASGAAVCGALPTPNLTGSDCRYVPVPSSTVAPGNAVQQVLTLSGPESAGGNNTCTSFQQGENQNTVQTYTGTLGESVGVSLKEGGAGFNVTEANTLTWTQSESTGTSSGSGVTQAVSLCSATVNCGEQVPIFEDTVYHTFVFMGGNASCP